MTVIGWDTETLRIEPCQQAPRLVCMTACVDGQAPWIVKAKEAIDIVRDWLADPCVTLVGHSVAYDVTVMVAAGVSVESFFDAYDAGRILDTGINEKLKDIAAGTYFTAKGRYSLDRLSCHYLDRKLDKGADSWRLRYSELVDVPLDEWPEDAKTYALLDALSTYQVWEAQQGKASNLEEQCKYDFWLRLIEVWGIKTDPVKAHLLEQETLVERNRIRKILEEQGLVRANGVRDTKAAQALIEQVVGSSVKRTPTGRAALDEDSCTMSCDPLLEAYSDYSTLSKVLSTDVPILRQATVHSRYGLAGTGRTTSSKPNIQNIRRMPGIRESFVPREGCVFIDADYNALELYSLAQACLDMFGESELATVLRSGKDPHTALAGDLLGITYEEAAKRKKDKKDKEFDNARQTAKVANFGLPGGLGVENLVLFARKNYRVVLTIDQAKELKAQWFARWLEMRLYFQHWTRETSNSDGLGSVVLPRSNRVRGNLRFTELCNTRFQGPASDAAKEAGWLIAKACYQDRTSPLWGCRPVAFIHDQWLIECPEDGGEHDAALETVRLMRLGAAKYLPDMIPPVEPLLCRYWSKEAEPRYKEDGTLGVWPS